MEASVASHSFTVVVTSACQERRPWLDKNKTNRFKQLSTGDVGFMSLEMKRLSFIFSFKGSYNWCVTEAIVDVITKYSRD